MYVSTIPLQSRFEKFLEELEKQRKAKMEEVSLLCFALLTSHYYTCNAAEQVAELTVTEANFSLTKMKPSIISISPLPFHYKYFQSLQVIKSMLKYCLRISSLKAARLNLSLMTSLTLMKVSPGRWMCTKFLTPASKSSMSKVFS